MKKRWVEIEKSFDRIRQTLTLKSQKHAHDNLAELKTEKIYNNLEIMDIYQYWKDYGYCFWKDFWYGTENDWKADVTELGR